MEMISVVIPTYNEDKNIAQTIRDLLDFSRRSPIFFEIIISDDGSEDRTLEVIRSFAESSPSVRILTNPHRGKAAAVFSGVSAARGKYLLFVDADGAVEIGQVSKLLSFLKTDGWDGAIGSREGRGARRISEPFYRHLYGRIFNLLVRTLFHLEYQDTQCGFKLFRTEVIKSIAEKSQIMRANAKNLKEPMVTAFDVEILILAERFGYKIAEVPVVWKHVPSKNILPMKDPFRMISDLVQIRWGLMTGKYK